MSEQDPSSRRRPPSMKVHCLGYECVLMRPNDVIGDGAANTTMLYEEEFTDVPVEKIRIISTKQIINGENALGLHGVIDLNMDVIYPDEVEGDFIDYLVDQNDDDVFDGGISIERTSLAGVARATGANGSDFLIQIKKDKSGSTAITFSNNNQVKRGDYWEVVFPAMAGGDKESVRAELETFLKVFMLLTFKTTSLLDIDADLDTGFPPERYILKPNALKTKKDITNKKIGEVVLFEKPAIPEFLIDDEILIRDPSVRLEDVGGLRDERQQIQELVSGFINPEIAKKWGVEPTQGVVLYGLPGVGKTMLAEAIASEIDGKIAFIQSNDIYDMWLGNSQKNMKRILDAIKDYKGENLVVVFDEMDSILHGKSNHSTERGVSGIFKQEMTALDNPNVLVIAITNNEDDIDPALVRSGRFNYKIYIKKPDEAERSSIVGKIISSFVKVDDSSFNPFDLTGDGVDIDEIAKHSEGLSGADLHEAIKQALRKKAADEHYSGEEPSRVNTRDILDQVDSINRQ